MKRLLLMTGLVAVLGCGDGGLDPLAGYEVWTNTTWGEKYIFDGSPLAGIEYSDEFLSVC